VVVEHTPGAVSRRVVTVAKACGRRVGLLHWKSATKDALRTSGRSSHERGRVDDGMGARVARCLLLRRRLEQRELHDPGRFGSVRLARFDLQAEPLGWNSGPTDQMKAQSCSGSGQNAWPWHDGRGCCKCKVALGGGR
jgi:hypothetical protein